jgi:hypothetical protein
VQTVDTSTNNLSQVGVLVPRLGSFSRSARFKLQPKGLRGLYHSFKKNFGIVFPLGHDHLLPDPFQFIYRTAIRQILLGKAEGKRPLGTPRRRWVDNIKMDLR